MAKLHIYLKKLTFMMISGIVALRPFKASPADEVKRRNIIGADNVTFYYFNAFCKLFFNISIK